MADYIAESELELTSPVSGVDFRRASAWLGEYGGKLGIPTEQIARLDLCLNEALANVVDHGGLAVRGISIRLHFNLTQLSDGHHASITVIDSGMKFNPLTMEVRPKPSFLEDAEAGGLGVTMIRSFSDELSYQYIDGCNHLTFAVKWQPVMQPVQTDMLPGVLVQRFNHGPDRRVKSAKLMHDRRCNERRKLGLGWLSIFHGADEAAVQAALAESDVWLISAGEILLSPGDINHNIYVLLSGKLGAYLDSKDDPEAVIPILPGECVGEFSAIDGKSVSAYVVALNSVRMLRLTQEVFWDRLMVVPGVARNMMVGLSERMRRTNEAVLEHQRKQLALQHLRKELEVAHQLQANMLPLRRPLFPDRDDIEVAAFMEPASEVGGDLFDVFFVDDRNLFICIGDVSGHGIPAAMFMARTIGLMRITAMNTLHPDELLVKINDQLCVGNDSNHFATLFCAFMDVESGRLVYSNGGHCAPMLCKGKLAEKLAIPSGTLVGAIPNLSYTAREITLCPGDTLICYTDGVTEARNSAGEEFTEERLGGMIERASGQPLEAMMETVRGEVGDFTGIRVLDDDFALLAVRFTARGNSKMEINTIENGAAALPKRRLGMFELEGEIGKGAMGTVYSGRDTISGRPVAIKTMKLESNFDPEKKGDAEQRFLAEARILTWLDHPGIVTIYDVGHEDGVAYIAMEFLKGVELSRHIEPGSLLPLPKTLDIIARVAEALDYAHEQGVVHRDVKPGNFMYDPVSDVVKVTDFGISKLADGTMTQVGVVLGSPFYMSPEQVWATGVSGRSDIFSLGTSLYQMVSGEFPFKGKGGPDVMYRIVKEPHQDILSINPDLPASLCEVINRALAKKPDDRYQRGNEMAEAIRRCLATI
jgi:sigma-B regulation protein RsbU (phosphoserine phosphatase)